MSSARVWWCGWSKPREASARTRARTAAALTERAHAKGGTDRTKYGSSRASTLPFYVHHMQQVSKAAVVHDARAIRVQIGCLKQRALERAGAAPTRGAAA